MAVFTGGKSEGAIAASFTYRVGQIVVLSYFAGKQFELDGDVPLVGGDFVKVELAGLVIESTEELGGVDGGHVSAVGVLLNRSYK